MTDRFARHNRYALAAALLVTLTLPTAACRDEPSNSGAQADGTRDEARPNEKSSDCNTSALENRQSVNGITGNVALTQEGSDGTSTGASTATNEGANGGGRRDDESGVGVLAAPEVTGPDSRCAEGDGTSPPQPEQGTNGKRNGSSIRRSGPAPWLSTFLAFAAAFLGALAGSRFGSVLLPGMRRRQAAEISEKEKSAADLASAVEEIRQTTVQSRDRITELRADFERLASEMKPTDTTGFQPDSIAEDPSELDPLAAPSIPLEEDRGVDAAEPSPEARNTEIRAKLNELAQRFTQVAANAPTQEQYALALQACGRLTDAAYDGEKFEVLSSFSGSAPEIHLAAVDLGDGSYAVLPSFHILMNFPTHYYYEFDTSTTIKAAFAIVSDESAILKCIEPAVLKREAGNYRLKQGRLKGFSRTRASPVVSA